MSVLGMSALSFAAVALLTPLLIVALKSLRLTQPIRKELPAGQQAKRGTPLMAGLILIIGVWVTLVTQDEPLARLVATAFILFGGIGFLDDFKKAYFQNPDGLSGKMKLLLQFIATGWLIWEWSRLSPLDPSIIITDRLELALPSAAYIVIILLFIVGTANAVNFTDGMDGLLIVVSIPTYLFFFAISDRQEVQAFALIMVGCLLGLLLYNVHPAKAFMGDTGSLAIGGSLSFLAVIEKMEIIIPVLFLVYFAEQLSVILQVWYYKRTRLRLFRMAPIHYHFSLKYGWKESKIVLVFGAVSLSSAFICWLYVLLFFP